MRLLGFVILVVALAVFAAAVTSRRDSTRLIGLWLAAALIVADLWMMLEFLAGEVSA